MKAIITVQMDNAAFHPFPDNDGPDHDGNGAELARILRELADRIEADTLDPGDTHGLHDVNGNRVGQLEVGA